MPNYAPKTDLKKTAGVDTSDFAKKIVDLANLKSDVGKLDIDKLKIVATNLNNLKIKVDKLDIDKFISVHSWNSPPPYWRGNNPEKGGWYRNVGVTLQFNCIYCVWGKK